MLWIYSYCLSGQCPYPKKDVFDWLIEYNIFCNNDVMITFRGFDYYIYNIKMLK